MLIPEFTAQFRKDLKRMQRRGKDSAKLRAILDDLIQERSLDPSRRDHPPKGEWQGHRDCHVAADWVLIHAIGDGVVRFVRTGTHADLFE